jgi:hypothetical protein
MLRITLMGYIRTTEEHSELKETCTLDSPASVVCPCQVMV